MNRIILNSSQQNQKRLWLCSVFMKSESIIWKYKAMLYVQRKPLWDGNKEKVF